MIGQNNHVTHMLTRTRTAGLCVPFSPRRLTPKKVKPTWRSRRLHLSEHEDGYLYVYLGGYMLKVFGASAPFSSPHAMTADKLAATRCCIRPKAEPLLDPFYDAAVQPSRAERGSLPPAFCLHILFGHYCCPAATTPAGQDANDKPITVSVHRLLMLGFSATPPVFSADLTVSQQISHSCHHPW